MKPYFVKTPSLVPLFYPNQTWCFSPQEKDLFLTFDDGPTPEVTHWVLEQLGHYDAKATFFCVGKNIEQYPEIFTRLIDEGHSVANHTYEHLNGWETTTEDYIASVMKTERIIQTISNSSRSRYPDNSLDSKLFRPPYGKIKRSQTRTLLNDNYRVIMWTVLSADFDEKVEIEKCINNVIRNATNGNIVVFHDSLKAFKTLKHALPKILDYFTKKGYRFKKIENAGQAKDIVAPG